MEVKHKIDKLNSTRFCETFWEIQDRTFKSRVMYVYGDERKRGREIELN